MVVRVIVPSYSRAAAEKEQRVLPPLFDTIRGTDKEEDEEEEEDEEDLVEEGDRNDDPIIAAVRQ